ncbi:MAG: TetR/AcrR family transcriptional regulator [Oceanospirillaceae bacterium]
MSDKKHTIIVAALQLFIQKGIHCVGINEVIKEAKVAKKTLYHYFPSKEALTIATLEYRDAIFMSWMRNSMQQAKSAEESLEALFWGLNDWFNNKAVALGNFHGCFFINAAAEYKEQSSAINQCCHQHKINVKNLVALYVEKFETDPQKALFITDSICILKEGAITSALVQHDLTAALKVIPLIKLLLTQRLPSVGAARECETRIKEK